MNDAIDLRLWRQFLAVAEHLHFGRAAQHLAMTQPPLTQAIQLLERRLGLTLFERTRRSVALTPAGAALLAPVRRLLRDASGLPELARAAERGGVGTLRLGFISTIGFGPLPGWLRAFREAEPGIAIALREATTDVQLRSLAQGDADAGFVLHAPGIAPAMSRLSVGVEALVLALPEAWPAARAPRLPMKSLLAEPLVIFPREVAPSLHDAILGFYHRHGAAPVVAQEAIQMQTIVNLVSAGLGVAWVPASMTQLQRPGVVYRKLPGAMADEAPHCETSLVWTEPAGPVVARFAGFVRDSLR